MLKKIFTYIFVIALGISLSLAYSYLINNSMHLETIVVFCILYTYVVVFFRFLIKLFK